MKNFDLLSLEFQKQINNYCASKKIGNTILINSESDTLNYQGAVYIACVLLCLKADFCEITCENCLRIINNKYADFLILNDKHTAFKKEQVNELIQKMHYSALEIQGIKVCLIQNIEAASLEATNALLKFFEEPSANTYTIITTKNINAVLDTIISRALVINLESSLQKTVLQKNIQVDLKYSQEDALLLSNCFVDWEEISNLSSENYLRIKKLVLQFCENILSNNFDENYLLARQIVKLEKSDLELFWKILMLLIKDVFLLEPKNFIATRHLVEKLKEKNNLLQNNFLEIIYECLDRLKVPINKSLLVDYFFIKTQQLITN